MVAHFCHLKKELEKKIQSREKKDIPNVSYDNEIKSQINWLIFGFPSHNFHSLFNHPYFADSVDFLSHNCDFYLRILTFDLITDI